ncbi:MAG: EamA family transporter [Mesorhizobium sp.]|uniref:DMT family transporter n=1 Tax=unclassified Mesorhizobium TaxID=325217 RepID=UPI000FCCCD23|nr:MULTISPECIES: DMT family transporter [unclassified Mesorhizobium]RUV44379.1 EamA family transporter [Mesorhizobium sp. M1A.T.Ca.IN.004.03.1.1]RWG21122.1 MAG: EamA family transporter [Mesorhizobium sp.]RWI89649.1 MAG: EamA family transporter [Mesorhizobium sp.]RWK34197.1 MAG: EamA family transporter [Mesorhizobium sp.]RWK87288.1 MAG: EamA family transporter [Mesorhizobium sp.]
MNATVVGLALSAAILHASWNAFLRTGVDRLWTVTVMSFSSTAAAIVLALFHPLPAAAAWPYVVLSAVLQVGYSVFLVAAYRYGELGQVYPIVRGSVPLLVALGGFLLAGQRLAAPELIGVALVACGIMGLSVGRGRASVTSILYALATGVIIAAYATVDAIGVRVAGDSAAYTAWVLLIYGALLPAAFVGLRGRLTVDLRAPETRKALSGGLFALLAYGAVVAAFALGPAGPITAIRETSVVFAAFIGRFFLGEQLTPRRIGACAVVALGAICLGYRP